MGKTNDYINNFNALIRNLMEENSFYGESFLVRYGFCQPANDRIFSIILLYVEMMTILTFITIIIGYLICLILDLFRADRKNIGEFKDSSYFLPIVHFTPKMEAFLDTAFAIFPTIIIIYLMVPALSFIFQLEYDEEVLESTFQVKVIGHQWYWTYELDIELATDIMLNYYDSFYDFKHISLDSYMLRDHPFNRLLETDRFLVLPAWHNIRFVITSEDVIHSWAIPQLGIKMDAIPGRMMNLLLPGSMPGVYYGQCSELCGINHAFMPIAVQIVPEKYFLDWVFLASGKKNLVKETTREFNSLLDDFYNEENIRKRFKKQFYDSRKNKIK